MSRTSAPGPSSSPGSPGRLVPVLAVVVVLLLVLLAIAGTRSYRDLEAAKRREELFLTKIQQTERRVESLRDRIRRLRNDPSTLERLAREELGMVRPGDVVIVLPEPD